MFVALDGFDREKELFSGYVMIEWLVELKVRVYGW